MSVKRPTIEQLKKEGAPDWKILMNIDDPKAKRPRRMSIHMIAGIVGRDPLVVLKEMEDSKEVAGYICPDVHTPIFYLDALSGMMIDTRNASCFKDARKKLEEFPFPATRGFKRFPSDRKYAMPTPFDPLQDADYKAVVEKVFEREIK